MKRMNVLMASLMLAGMGSLLTAEDMKAQNAATPAAAEKPAKVKKARGSKKAKAMEAKKEASAAMYQCDHCKKTSDKAGNCCGMEMKKI